MFTDLERLRRITDHVDRGGRRIDSVTYHPAYHELMRLAFGMGLHSLAWTEDRPGAFVARWLMRRPRRCSTNCITSVRTASPPGRS